MNDTSRSGASRLQYIAGFAVILLVGVALGEWFSLKQIHAVYAQASLKNFPLYAHFLTVARCALAVTAAAVLSHMAICAVCGKKTSFLATACMFLPLLAACAGFAPACALAGVLLLHIATAGFYLRGEGLRILFRRYGRDVAALLALLCVHVLCSTAFIPFHGGQPLISMPGRVTEEIPVVAPIYRQYTLAGQYSFASVDYSEWGAVMHPPITLNSTLLQLATLVFGLPPVSVEAFHAVLQAIQLLLIVGGSFGVYLFLKYAASLHPFIALAGGALYFTGGVPLFENMYLFDGGVFLAPLAVFPYALLCISLAFTKEDYKYALLAGMVLASQFFFYSPHPEGTMYSVLFFTVYALGLCCLFRSGQWGNIGKLLAPVLAVAVFTALAAFAVLPVTWDTMAGYMHTFAHTGDIGTNSLKAYMRYIVTFTVLVVLSFGKNSPWRKGNPVHNALMFLAAFLFLTVCATSLIQFNRFVVHVLHLGVHLGGMAWRIGLYLYFSVLWVAMITLDGFAKNITEKTSLRVVPLVLAACAFLVFPVTFLGDYSKQDNPQGCRYYVTLQSLLVNARGMAANDADAALVRERLDAFRRDLAAAPQEVRDAYETAYVDAEKNAISKDSIGIASAVFRVVDSFYMDKRLFCANPLYDFAAPAHVRRILRHNLAGLYENLPPYKTILCSGSDWTLGATPGLWVNNQTMTFDTRFMTAMPLLTALYVLPGFDYIDVGKYTAPLPMLYFSYAELSSPRTRKLLDVAGIDVFTLPSADAAKGLPDTSPLASDVNPRFNPGLVSLVNHRSYGLAYLADRIMPISKSEVVEEENALKRYFAGSSKNEADFVRITQPLYDKITSLRNRYDIVLESDAASASASDDAPSGSVSINGVVGEKASFTADCKRRECEMVFNISAAPGWRAYVNGSRVAVERANFAFIAVKVPHGKSSVWLIYEPAIQIIGDALSLLALILLPLLAAGRRCINPRS